MTDQDFFESILDLGSEQNYNLNQEMHKTQIIEDGQASAQQNDDLSKSPMISGMDRFTQNSLKVPHDSLMSWNQTLSQQPASNKNIQFIAPQSEPLLPISLGDFDDEDSFLTPLMSPSITPIPSMEAMNLSSTRSNSVNSFSGDQINYYLSSLAQNQHQLAVTPSMLMNLNNDHHTAIPSAQSQINQNYTQIPLPKINVRASTDSFEIQSIQNAGRKRSVSRASKQQNTAQQLSSAMLRKSNHKIAEQRRRDAIKKHFDLIKDLLPNLGDEKNISKLYILEKTYEHLLQVHTELDFLRKIVTRQQQ